MRFFLLSVLIEVFKTSYIMLEEALQRILMKIQKMVKGTKLILLFLQKCQKLLVKKKSNNKYIYILKKNSDILPYDAAGKIEVCEKRSLYSL